ncbi:unnamed protein product, partial [marine sediment metagenome]
SAGTLDSITKYVKWDSGVPAYMKAAIYDVTSGNLLENGETDQESFSSPWDDWLTMSFPSKPTVEAATGYWLCWKLSHKSLSYRSAGDIGQSGYISGHSYLDPFPAEFPDPFNLINVEYSIFATYEEVPPPAVKTLVQATLISAIPLIAIPTLAEILRLTGV